MEWERGAGGSCKFIGKKKDEENRGKKGERKGWRKNNDKVGII